MWSDKKLTQAADDIVRGDSPDAFPPARRLMFAAMRKAITPFHVWEVHRWARAKADEHAARADALRRIIDASALKHEGVDALEAHRGAVQGRGAGGPFFGARRPATAGHSMVCARGRARPRKKISWQAGESNPCLRRQAPAC